MPKISKNIKEIIEIVQKLNLKHKNLTELIAVSKNFGEESIIHAIKSGITNFGENRIQECLVKYNKILNIYPNIKLHMVGPLQTNKLKKALELFDTIHTIDREKLVKHISKNISLKTKKKNFFIQVNIGLETQKFGITPNETHEFVNWCKNDYNLNVIGLMCIPPMNFPAEEYFVKIKELALTCNLQKLSMGMSNDYKIAIKCGATHIRLGTAIFGERL